jgi:hypothetical protein
MAEQINPTQIMLIWQNDGNASSILHTYRDGIYVDKFSGHYSSSTQETILNLTDEDRGVYVFYIAGLNTVGVQGDFIATDPLTVTYLTDTTMIGIYDNEFSVTDISGSIDYDADASKSLTLRWDSVPTFISDNTINYHIYKLDANNSNGFGSYIGQTNSGGSSNTFNWKNATYGDHQFAIFAIRADGTHHDVIYSGTCTLAHSITVTDDVNSHVDLSNGQDTDSANAKQLVIRWNFDAGNNPDLNNAKAFHVYVKVNNGEYTYLGRTDNLVDHRFVWEQTTQVTTAASFRSGPQFGQTYEFEIFQLKNAFQTGERPNFGPFKNSGPINFITE